MARVRTDAVSGEPDDLHVRAVTIDDASAVADIYAPVVETSAISFELTPPTADEFAARIERVTTSDPWLVCEQNSIVLGYAYATDFRARPAYAKTRESTVYVRDGAHGLGVGSRLMATLLDLVADAGAHRVMAGIVLPNPASIALHERFGFRHVGTFGQVGHKFDQWHDLGFWQYNVES